MRRLLKGAVYAAVLLTFGILAGCGKKDGDEPIIMVDSSEDEVVYNMDEVTKGDVVLTKNIACKYVQTSSQDVIFNEGGKQVDKVHVKIGDSVKVGDLLVELESGDLEDRIATLEYQINRNKLQLGYLDKAEEFDKQNSYFSFVYGGFNASKTEDDVKDYDKSIESLEESYTYQREDYQDSIEFDQRKLEKLKNEYEGNRVYATMEGKVLYVRPNLEGYTSKKDEVVMTIVDNDNGLFEINDAEASKFFKEGEAVSMSISYGDAKGDYELIPHNMNEWGESSMFEILVSPETATLEVGVSGTILAPIDKRENVLRIPVKALYQADGKYYTYVLSSNNMREARFIDIGLVGDDYAEVTGGIELGTKVVKR